MKSFPVVLRNCVCELVAFLLILSGRVRRAKKRAFEAGNITALYFHKPNRRLFERIVRTLQRDGYRFLSGGEMIDVLHKRRAVPRGAVWISFDDGCREVLAEVLPVIRKYGVPATWFIPSGIVAGDGRFPWLPHSEHRHSITVDELRAVARIPEITIGSHTVSHVNAALCNHDQMLRELSDSKHVLEAWTGKRVTQFAYPYGARCNHARALTTQAGYELAATTENAFITKETSLQSVPRFSIGDDIGFLEARCNIVGVWRPLADSLKSLVRRPGRPAPSPSTGTHEVSPA